MRGIMPIKHRRIIKDGLFIIAILFFTVFVQAFFISPPILSDDMEYFYWATKFPHMPQQPTHWSLRSGLILPVAVLYRIFGYAEIAYYVVPFASLALLTCGTCWLGSRLFNPRVGLFAALWLAVIPSLLIESTLLLPDIPATACVTVGFAILASLARKTNEVGQAQPASSWWYLLAGVFFGWAYLVKEYYLLFILVIPIAWVTFRLPWKKIIVFLAGMAAMAGIEAVLGILIYGNPFIRLMTAQPRETFGFIERDILRIATYFPSLLRQKGGWGSLALSITGLTAMAVGVFKKSRPFAFLLGWVLIPYVLFTAIGLLPVFFSWEDVTLLRLHKFRYWTLILPPLFIAGAAGLEWAALWLINKSKVSVRRTLPVLNLALTLLITASTLIGMQGVYNFFNLIRNGADHYLELRDYLDAHDDEVDLIWINRDIKVSFDRILPMYKNNFWGQAVWEGRVKYLNTGQEYLREDELTSGWLLVDRYFFKTRFQRIPEYLENPPEDWTLVFESEDKEIALYEVR